MTTVGRHPTDAERAQSAAPLVASVVEAVETGDVSRLAACFRDDATLLTGGDPVVGPDGARAHLEPTLTGGKPSVTRREQHGAHAVIGWAVGSAGHTLAIEVRRDAVVFAVHVAH